MAFLTALMIGSQVAGHMGEVSAAEDQNAATAAAFEASERFRQKMDRYNNQIFKQDIGYFNDLLDYQQQEFGRQAVAYDKAKTAIGDDYISQVGQLLTRMTEEYVATNLLGESAVREGRRARAAGQVASAEMGVQGNSIDSLLNDVRRQVGETMTGAQRQQRSVMRQLQNEALGLSARADSEIASIPLQSFQPLTPARAPAPSQPGTAPAMNPGPSIGKLVGGIGGSYTDFYRNRNMAMPKSLVDTFLLKPGPLLS